LRGLKGHNRHRAFMDPAFVVSFQDEVLIAI
jgi:hypothetical protein